MAATGYWGGHDRREGAYDQRLWREERRRNRPRAGTGAGTDAGREAESPGQIPARGWRSVVSRVRERMREDNLSIISAGVAFYALLSLFPALAALVAIYGLVADPQQIEGQVASLSAMLPAQAAELITGQLHDLVQTDRTALGLGAAVGVLLALWSASKGVRTLMAALNVAYHEEESRGTLTLLATSLALTLAAIAGFIVMIGLIVAAPVAARFIGLGDALESLVDLSRWPVVALTVVVGLAVMFRYGPSRDEPRWRWASPGAVIATLLWIAGTVLFSLYVSRFGNYNETYGAMGAVVILLMWLLLSAYVVLIGALVNAEMERQTRKDTTAGSPKPMGRRGAYAADTVGRSA